MYEPYWRLEHAPFAGDAGSHCYFAAGSHEGALLKLRYTIERGEQCGLLVGEHGLGKTYLSRVLTDGLETARYEVIRVVFPRVSSEALLDDIAARLGVETRSNDRLSYGLEQRLRHISAEDRRVVVTIDEAHLLDAPHLQTLQLLLNLGEAAGCEQSLILIGQPQLLPVIRRAGGLSARVSVRTTLHPLTQEETAEYVRHRLRLAGRDECPFSDETLSTLHELSQGVPRQINHIADLALLIGFADELQSLSPVEVEAAAAEVACVSVD